MVNEKTIRIARKKLGLTQADLARSCSCATNTIGRIERGQLQPSQALLQRIAQALGVPPSALDSHNDPEPTAAPTEHLRNVLHVLVERMSNEEVTDFSPLVDAWAARESHQPPRTPAAAAPEFDIVDVEQLPPHWPGSYLPVIGRLAAGQGIDTTEAESYPAGLAHTYLRYQNAPPNAFSLVVEGCSMAPQFGHGDIVIVDPSQTIEAGLCAALTDDGTGQRIARLKKLVLDGPTARLESLNPAYPTITVPAGRVQAFAVWRHLPLNAPRRSGAPGYRWP